MPLVAPVTSREPYASAKRAFWIVGNALPTAICRPASADRHTADHQAETATAQAA